MTELANTEYDIFAYCDDAHEGHIWFKADNSGLLRIALVDCDDDEDGAMSEHACLGEEHIIPVGAFTRECLIEFFQRCLRMLEIPQGVNNA